MPRDGRSKLETALYELIDENLADRSWTNASDIIEEKLRNVLQKYVDERIMLNLACCPDEDRVREIVTDKIESAIEDNCFDEDGIKEIVETELTDIVERLKELEDPEKPELYKYFTEYVRNEVQAQQKWWKTQIREVLKEEFGNRIGDHVKAYTESDGFKLLVLKTVKETLWNLLKGE